jgi:methylphosphotriester-DNA--protein-cysteine methyltransferase
MNPPRPRGPRGRGDWIDSLPPDLRVRYERQVLADPRTTAEAARQWLLGHGVRVSLASVLRHRNWLARDDARRTRDDAAAHATRRRAAALGLTPQDMAAGQALRHAHQLFEATHALYKAVNDTGEPAPPEKVLALARMLRAVVR